MTTPPSLSRRPGRNVPSIEQVVQRIRGSVVHQALTIVADPWNPHVLLMVWLGNDRFELLVEALQVSRSSLTQRLRLLVDEACLLREAEAGGHARYRLSEKGADLLGVLVLNRQWNSRWGAPQRVAPELRFAHDCGAPLHATLVCAHCEAEVRARDVKVLETAASPVSLPPLPPYRRARQHGAHREEAAGGPGEAVESRRRLAGEELAGDRWTGLILAVAFMGCKRNAEIEQAIGIAPNVLAARLALLTDNEIFRRVRYQSRPERYEYILTEKGLDRHAIVLAMMQWGQKWVAPQHPQAWDTLHKPCYEWLRPSLVCAACRGPVNAQTIQAA